MDKDGRVTKLTHNEHVASYKQEQAKPRNDPSKNTSAELIHRSLARETHPNPNEGHDKQLTDLIQREVNQFKAPGEAGWKSLESHEAYQAYKETMIAREKEAARIGLSVGLQTSSLAAIDDTIDDYVNITAYVSIVNDLNETIEVKLEDQGIDETLGKWGNQLIQRCDSQGFYQIKSKSYETFSRTRGVCYEISIKRKDHNLCNRKIDILDNGYKTFSMNISEIIAQQSS